MFMQSRVRIPIWVNWQGLSIITEYPQLHIKSCSKEGMIVKEIEIKAMYEKPEMQVIKLNMIEVVTASGDEPFLGDDEVWI